MQCLLYINLILCNSLCYSLFSNTVYTIINQSSYFIKQQRVIKKVTTHRGAPWRFVTSWFKSQKDLIKNWINPRGNRCYIDSIDGHREAYFFSLVSVNMLGKGTKNFCSCEKEKFFFLWERKSDFLGGGGIICNDLCITFLPFQSTCSFSLYLPWCYLLF